MRTRSRRVALAMSLALLAALAAPAAALAADAWLPAASMATARYAHTATLLKSGKVLVAGGYTGSVASASAELYDPVSNTWSSARSMTTARAGHTATLLASGKVLVAGGGPAELYDPVGDTWSSAGSSIQGLRSATLLASGKVLVANSDGDAELYDPVSNTWSAAGSMTEARDGYVATRLASGKVLVTGGFTAAASGGFHPCPSGTAELYDPVGNTWSAAGSMTDGRRFHTSTLLANGKVLIAGGAACESGVNSTAELYDPASGAFSPTGSMPQAVENHVATLLVSGKVLVSGGDGLGGLLVGPELYDPTSGTWSEAASMRVPRTSQTATRLASGRVLVTGGYEASGLGDGIASAELYVPATLSVSLLNPGEGGRFRMGQAVLATYWCTGTGIRSCRGPVASGARIDTSTIGAHAFSVTASDASGTQAGRTVHYAVFAACQRRELALTDLHVKGRRVIVGGVADRFFAGQHVLIALGSKTVGSATIGADGRFTTSVARPPRHSGEPARYRASVAGHSVGLRLERRSALTRARLSHGKLTLAGRVTGRFKVGARVVIQSIALCDAPKQRLASTHLTRRGRWQLTLPAPAGATTLLYRARTTLARGPTYTIPRPATR